MDGYILMTFKKKNLKTKKKNGVSLYSVPSTTASHDGTRKPCTEIQDVTFCCFPLLLIWYLSLHKGYKMQAGQDADLLCYFYGMAACLADLASLLARPAGNMGECLFCVAVGPR